MSNQTEEQEVGLDGTPIPVVPVGVIVPYRMSTERPFYLRGARGIRWFLPYAARISELEELL